MATDPSLKKHWHLLTFELRPAQRAIAADVSEALGRKAALAAGARSIAAAGSIAAGAAEAWRAGAKDDTVSAGRQIWALCECGAGRDCREAVGEWVVDWVNGVGGAIPMPTMPPGWEIPATVLSGPATPKETLPEHWHYVSMVPGLGGHMEPMVGPERNLTREQARDTIAILLDRHVAAGHTTQAVAQEWRDGAAMVRLGPDPGARYGVYQCGDGLSCESGYNRFIDEIVTVQRGLGVAGAATHVPEGLWSNSAEPDPATVPRPAPTEPADIIAEMLVGAIPGRAYPEPLPPDLAPWYIYPADSGHSIAVVIAEHRRAHPERPTTDFLLPFSVRTVLRLGWTMTPEGIPMVSINGTDVRYDRDLGLVTPEEDYEF